MRALSLLGLIIGLGLGCRSAAPVRDPAAASECGKRPDYENNCVACTSQPICGWCEHRGIAITAWPVPAPFVSRSENGFPVPDA